MSLLASTRASCSCAHLAPTLRPAAATFALPVRRALHAPASAPKERLVPSPRGTSSALPCNRTAAHDASLTLGVLASTGSITSTGELLAASGRALTQYEAKLGDWQDLFTKSGADLRDAGMTATERRYLLWLLEKFRQGHDIAAVAVPSKPKKKIRGWGPRSPSK